MPSSKQTLFIIFTILVVLMIILCCGLIIQPQNNMLNNVNGLTSETLRTMSGEEPLYEHKTSNISSVKWSQTNLNMSVDVSIPDQETPYHRIDRIPEETEKLPFLKNFKNPCWRESLNDKNSSRIRCLPFFHSVGPRKCGTTDIHIRLIRHPQISSNVMKEIQWIAPDRFSNKKEALLSKYLQYFDNAVTKDIIPSAKNGYHDAIIGDFSPTTLFFNKHYWKSPIPNFTSNADVIHHLYPDSKIIVTLRNPVTRSYSDFKHFTRNPTPELFHTEVIAQIEEFDRSCRNASYLRKCIDAIRLPKSEFLLIGIYYVNIEDYLRLFPRRQILITKVEDRHKNMTSALKKIFSFLEIRSLSEEEIADIVKLAIQNRRRHHIPEMFNKTRLILEEFYKPFNEKLGKLIGQEYDHNLYD